MNNFLTIIFQIDQIWSERVPKCYIFMFSYIFYSKQMRSIEPGGKMNNFLTIFFFKLTKFGQNGFQNVVFFMLG